MKACTAYAWLKKQLLMCGILAVIAMISACSTTQSDVRRVSIATDRSSAIDTLLAVTGQNIRTSFQDSSALHTLHSDADTVLAIARIVARHYGFTLVAESEAEYVLDIKSAVPDGGACVDGVESAELNASYTLSLLTLGSFPATAVHCLVVNAELYDKRSRDERMLMGAFESNAGSVELVAGINDLKVYQRTVKPDDERRGLEASFGALLSELIDEGAFQ